jgi:hypothetical protein
LDARSKINCKTGKQHAEENMQQQSVFDEPIDLKESRVDKEEQRSKKIGGNKRVPNEGIGIGWRVA